MINDSEHAFLIADDSVQDKRYSRFIELVRNQYSGTEHGLVCGIGVVNLVHSSGAAGDFYPIDYRIYAPETDGKTKNDHFRDMLVHALADKRIQAKTVYQVKTDLLRHYLRAELRNPRVPAFQPA